VLARPTEAREQGRHSLNPVLRIEGSLCDSHYMFPEQPDSTLRDAGDYVGADGLHFACQKSAASVINAPRAFSLARVGGGLRSRTGRFARRPHQSRLE